MIYHHIFLYASFICILLTYNQAHNKDQILGLQNFLKNGLVLD